MAQKNGELLSNFLHRQFLSLLMDGRDHIKHEKFVSFLKLGDVVSIVTPHVLNKISRKLPVGQTNLMETIRLSLETSELLSWRYMRRNPTYIPVNISCGVCEANHEFWLLSFLLLMFGCFVYFFFIQKWGSWRNNSKSIKIDDIT